MATVLGALGTLTLTQVEPDLDRASTLLEESTTLLRELGDKWALANLLLPRAVTASFRGEITTALLFM